MDLAIAMVGILISQWIDEHPMGKWHRNAQMMLEEQNLRTAPCLLEKNVEGNAKFAPVCSRKAMPGRP
jgi:hypothetical protein